ncbi:MAG: hypothetical protein Q9219_007369 [cf. Caloplaca sp. 3 TL-2023]
MPPPRRTTLDTQRSRQRIDSSRDELAGSKSAYQKRRTRYETGALEDSSSDDRVPQSKALISGSYSPKMLILVAV